MKISLFYEVSLSIKASFIYLLKLFFRSKNYLRKNSLNFKIYFRVADTIAKLFLFLSHYRQLMSAKKESRPFPWMSALLVFRYQMVSSGVCVRVCKVITIKERKRPLMKGEWHMKDQKGKVKNGVIIF